MKINNPIHQIEAKKADRKYDATVFVNVGRAKSTHLVWIATCAQSYYTQKARRNTPTSGGRSSFGKGSNRSIWHSAGHSASMCAYTGRCDVIGNHSTRRNTCGNGGSRLQSPVRHIHGRTGIAGHFVCGGSCRVAFVCGWVVTFISLVRLTTNAGFFLGLAFGVRINLGRLRVMMRRIGPFRVHVTNGLRGCVGQAGRRSTVSRTVSLGRSMSPQLARRSESTVTRFFDARIVCTQLRSNTSSHTVCSDSHGTIHIKRMSTSVRELS